jgi:leucyl/phenylalanyl-tRNA--protein transferase
VSWDWPFRRRPGATGRDVPWIPPELGDAQGLIGVGGDLSPDTLVRAYSEGVFPWYNEGDPILWWSPDPRAVIELGGLRVSHRLARTIRSGRFRTTVDRRFAEVMRACGETRAEGTWVTDDMLAAYTELHRRGHAHSLEVWQGEELAGGIYGVAVGGLFAGESMFHHKTDASKVALVALVERLRQRGYVLFDVQMKTDHTERMGAAEIPRAEYLRRLHDAVRLTGVTFA